MFVVHKVITELLTFRDTCASEVSALCSLRRVHVTRAHAGPDSLLHTAVMKGTALVLAESPTLDVWPIASLFNDLSFLYQAQIGVDGIISGGQSKKRDQNTFIKP